MQILQDDLVTATSSDQGNLGSDFVVGNITNDDPNQPYLPDADNCKITITVASGMQALFISGLSADDAWIQIVTSAGEDGYSDKNTTPYSALIELANHTRNKIPPEWFNFTILDSALTILPASYSGGTITEMITGSATTVTLSGTMTLGGMLVVGLEDGENYISNGDTGTALGACTVYVNLRTTTDRKDSPVSGNSIYQWDQGSSAFGRFEDSSGNAVNLKDFQNVRIGSIVKISGTDYQVVKIIGDGTGTSDVELSASVSDATITTIRNPIRLGIFRAGSILDVENPKIGLSQSMQDYSIRRPITDGGYIQTPRNVAKMFNASFLMTDENAKNMEGFYYAFRSKPFACFLTEDMPTSTDANTRNSGFFYLTNPPSISYATHSGNYSNVSLSFREVI